MSFRKGKNKKLENTILRFLSKSLNNLESDRLLGLRYLRQANRLYGELGYHVDGFTDFLNNVILKYELKTYCLH